jgi:hypothetical protein
VQCGLAALQLADINEMEDRRVKRRHVGRDHVDHVEALGLAQLLPVRGQGVHDTLDDGEGCAQLVAHGHDEPATVVVHALARFFQFLARRDQVLFRGATTTP